MSQEKVPASPLAVLQLFRVVFRAAQQYSADTEKTLGISGAQAWLMAELYEHGPQKAGELAARMAIKPATLSNMLIRMGEMGYITRQRSERDQRVVEVSLTEQGQQLMAAKGCTPRGWLPEALGKLPPEQLVSLAGGLEAMLAVMGVPAEGGDKPLPFTE
ncbi:DNA-binding MarR family transcriptional regulator [Vogesella perlucida]|nr:DNA-binding MarR family transcriptional regulator [Vogesella perlucida]